jgi:hypothetical protein
MENKDNGKKKTPSTPLQKKDKLNALDRAQINELLSDSIQNYICRVKKEAKTNEEAMNLVNNYLSEFLQAFMVFGYDMKGRPICFHYAENQMDADALNSLINRALFQRGEM